ncbi:endoplasmic reticulum vesicle transporter (macronuclear) [Tetrahymena thermophila SB210]|uniref:Endoplasmic reticulum vesicle transporter n=1 Tax=Tetrahymena thermophila (strain SB210) TaxID=312017 RepID=Q234K9_TETTS|nr:endoplasmic reticulum vesicle transporter [Tetrahymena thermophila SB210]EAR91994.1 endoplasmic reticulum vesicle transporter [Tetrahymena thermophila SB210]|eukprot:XP_001012239.1 endoplasmic reticulum vesicle transporter [Tetrahymena thermophila SB210]
MQSFRKFDAFQKVNQDIDSSSSVGGLFSIIALAIGFILFCHEFQEWNKYTIVRKLEVQSLNQAIIKANIDLTFFNVPCSLISLDVLYQDGQQVLQDYSSTLTRIKLDRQNKEIGTETTYVEVEQENSQQKIEEVLEQIKNKEQCRIHGQLLLNTIPGSFKFRILQMKGLDEQLLKQLNINHKINKLSFGDTIKTKKIEKVLGLDKSDSEAFDESRYNYEYRCSYDNYIKILPLNAENIKELGYIRTNSFRFTMYQQVIPKEQTDIIEVSFNYQVSPINIVYQTKNKSFYSFVVQVCAIIGGIFCVFGVINTLVLNIISSINSK